MLDFGALPPEINSARMYAGPGSGPMMAAASAWNGLAAELNSAAAGYEAVITRLASEEWMGPASASMAEAATPYVAWMSTTATQAEQAATQASAAAGAYETAFAATVPPPLIAANRAELAQLVATNVLGQNIPAIAQVEAQYSEMWAQDAAAMYSYAGQAATAAKVTPFVSPAQTTNPAGQALQASAVTQAAGTATGTSSQSVLSQVTSSVPTTLQSLATPTASSTTTTDPFSAIWQLLTGSSTPPTSLSGLLNAYAPYAGFFYNTEGLPYFSIGMGNNFVQMAKTFGLIGGSAPAAGAGAGAGAGAAAGAGAGAGLGGLGGGAPVAAGLGNAASVGRLSVPPAWTGAGAALSPVSTSPLPISSVSAAPEGSGAGNLLGGMPLAGAGAGGAGSGPRYGFRPTVMARPPFAG